MNKFLSSFKAKLLGAVGFAAVATTSVMASPVTVDLTEATTSINNAGSAIIGLVVVILGLSVVIGFLSNRKP